MTDESVSQLRGIKERRKTEEEKRAKDEKMVFMGLRIERLGRMWKGRHARGFPPKRDHFLSRLHLHSVSPQLMVIVFNINCTG